MVQANAVAALLAACLVAGCATPLAGPNAGAQANARAGAADLATKPTVGQELAAVAQNHVGVLFPAGGAVLTPDADRQLDLATRLFRDANPVVMFTAGYSDRSGDEYSNVVLSARRAEAVKRGLVARGIPAERILIQAFGASELADADKPLDASNRRVVISWRLL